MRKVYKYNEETKELELIACDNKGVPMHVYFPKDTIHSGAHFENLHDKTFATRREKREYMKRNHIAEAG